MHRATRTKALRQWRMTSAKDIKPTVIKGYIREAITLVDSGKQIKAERSRSVVVPDELATAMRRHKAATAAFRKLTPGRRRPARQASKRLRLTLPD